MLEIIKKWIDQQGLLEKGDRVLAACSGGPDSLALVHILYQLRSDYNISLAVAHVNHMLRGAESDADAASVAAFCAQLNIPYHEASVDVAGLMKQQSLSLEEAARILRYRFLRETAAKLGDAKIATGHHRDDQAETVLINLFRGAGSAGLSGIKPSGGGIIRPFLAVSRRDIEAYCLEHNLSPRIDSSNLKTEYLRNWLRLELIPLLEARLDANVTDALCRTAALAGDEYDFITGCALEKWRELGRIEDGDVIVDCRKLVELHLALKREIIRQAIAKKRGHLTGITFRHVEKVLELVTSGRSGSLLELPGGLLAKKGYGTVSFTDRRPSKGPRSAPGTAVHLNIPGETRIPEMDLEVEARVLDAPPPVMEGIFDLDQLELPLTLRTRRLGDRFSPAGMAGSKKLKEFFIDAKVPRDKRDDIPIITDNSEIIWIGGYRQARRGKPTNLTRRFLQLILKKQED